MPFALLPVERPVVDADGQAVVVRFPQILKDQLGQAAGVAENQRSAVGGDQLHDLRRGVAARMPAPGHPAQRQQDIDIRVRALFAQHQRHRIDIAIGRDPGAVTIGIGHRGRQRRAAHGRRDPLQSGQRQSQQIAAFLRGEGVHLVDHHALQIGEQRHTVRVRQQQAERFRRGQQNIGWAAALARLAVRRGVAGAGLDGQVEPDLLDRRLEIALDVHCQRLERGDIERMQPLDRTLGRIGQSRQKARQRLARPGGGHQQRMMAGPVRNQHGRLMIAHAPAAPSEPVGQCAGQRVAHRVGLAQRVSLGVFLILGIGLIVQVMRGAFGTALIGGAAVLLVAHQRPGNGPDQDDRPDNGG